MEFVCLDPTATVRAANVRATHAAFTLMPSMGEQLAARHQLDLSATPHQFIPVQNWLNALREIQTEVGQEVVRRVGFATVDEVDVPDNLSDANAVLRHLDELYYANHRGNVGHYVVTADAESIVISCQTPYPRHFEYGLVEGICETRRAGRRYFVDFLPGPEGSDVSCTMTVTWT